MDMNMSHAGKSRSARPNVHSTRGCRSVKSLSLSLSSTSSIGWHTSSSTVIASKNMFGPLFFGTQDGTYSRCVIWEKSLSSKSLVFSWRAQETTLLTRRSSLSIASTMVLRTQRPRQDLASAAEKVEVRLLGVALKEDGTTSDRLVNRSGIPPTVSHKTKAGASLLGGRVANCMWRQRCTPQQCSKSSSKTVDMWCATGSRSTAADVLLLFSSHSVSSSCCFFLV